MPTIPQRIASAFAVLCGRSGDVTQMAKDREQSRQSLYRAAEQVANAVDGAAAQARIDELQRQLAELHAHVQALQERLKHAVEITSDKQHESATVAQAEGVSLSVARRLFRVVARSDSTPSVPTLGRATLEAGKRAGGLLKVLDEAARPAVKQGTADEIFPSARQLVRASRASSSLPYRVGQRSLGQHTRPSPSVEFVVLPRGFQRRQCQDPFGRPTHPLVLATSRHLPVVALLHTRARDTQPP